MSGPAGVILAGGRSKRMGAPKPLVRVAGLPMIVRVARAIGRVCDRLVVVAPDPLWSAGLDAEVVGDPAPFEGPLAGIAAGIGAAGERGVVVGCDMPLLDPEALRRLMDAAGDAPGAVPVHPDGRLEPLHALYPAAAAEVAMSLLRAGTRRADALASEAGCVLVDSQRVDPTGRSWRNVNTPEDLLALELSAPGPDQPLEDT